jgi:hypothetical protein
MSKRLRILCIVMSLSALGAPAATATTVKYCGSALSVSIDGSRSEKPLPCPQNRGIS